ncbi:MAG: hypothetical protein II290_08110 [Oscillospiraceae bacterium]|jgi:hypothetical protein|nr:hypothetical protein [Oscillospiraceae bacterium]
MEEIFIPTLHTFAMKNTFTGSAGMFRFRIVPKVQMKTPKEVDYENSSIFAEFWHGLYCYEKSQIEGEATFPMTEQGRMELISWLSSNV